MGKPNCDDSEIFDRISSPSIILSQPIDLDMNWQAKLSQSDPSIQSRQNQYINRLSTNGYNSPSYKVSIGHETVNITEIARHNEPSTNPTTMIPLNEKHHVIVARKGADILSLCFMSFVSAILILIAISTMHLLFKTNNINTSDIIPFLLQSTNITSNFLYMFGTSNLSKDNVSNLFNSIYDRTIRDLAIVVCLLIIVLNCFCLLIFSIEIYLDSNMINIKNTSCCCLFSSSTSHFIAICSFYASIPALILGLHIELGDCRSYHYDMIYLRDVFDLRQENSNELYCTINQNTEHSHWTQVPALNYNYKKPIRTLSKLLSLKELQENCFDQFTKKQYTINSYTDLQEFYSYFHIYESYTIPLWTIYPYATLPNLPISSTRKTSTILFNNQSIYPSKIDYINIYEYGLLFNQTRWLSSIETYPDGRFIIIDNRNQQLLLLNENGTYIIDLTTIYFHQIQLKIHEQYSQSTINNAYSYSQIYIDQDGYSYLISKLAYFIYIFTPDNRLIRYLTPQLLSISIIRSDCLAITYTGLIYICDDTYRVIRIYTRMGVPQRTIRLNYLPLKLFIRNNRLFTYSMEQTANIQMYTLLGIHIRTLSMCSYRLPTEVVWFRGKYFLTCGIYLFVLDEQGEQIAEHSLHTLLDYSNTSLIINDFALNKNGLFLVIFRRNGTLFNRYWIIRPTTV
ncbi:unnamed protein product [Rotaria sp. Silwood1]|nr:unnamed protein product [Rotaria sp. Silwood1]